MADSSEGQMDGVSSSSPMMASPVATPRSGSFMTPSPPPPSIAPSGSPLVIVGGNNASGSGSVLNPSIERLEQENRVLKIEVDTLKLRIKSLLEENKSLRRASVSIQAKAEQEEEYISNTLLKKIQTLKKEKETLALNYEQEEECLTNDLSRKLNQLRAEKVNLEHTLEQEQETLVNKLMRKIEKLESETQHKQNNLEQLRREKIELENTLEQEQEALVNKLWKRMDKLETEKRDLQDKLENLSAASVCSTGDLSNHSSSLQMTPSQSPGPAPMSPAGVAASQPASVPPSQPASVPPSTSNPGQCLLKAAVCPTSSQGSSSGCMCDPAQLSNHVRGLRSEVVKLRSRLAVAEREQTEKMASLERDEREQREQNIKLRKKLQIEIERRERLCRHLSESESSLEIDFDDRQHGAMSDMGSGMLTPSSVSGGGGTSAIAVGGGHRHRALSSPVPMNMSPTASKAPPPTPQTINSPINASNQEDNAGSSVGGSRHLCSVGSYGTKYIDLAGSSSNSSGGASNSARPVSPLSRHKIVGCPKCGHSFLASIGSYTNLFSLGLHGGGAATSASHSSSVSSMGAPPLGFGQLGPIVGGVTGGGGGGSGHFNQPLHPHRYNSSDGGSSSGFHSLPSPLSQPMTPSESMILSGSDQELDKAGLTGAAGGGTATSNNSEEQMGAD